MPKIVASLQNFIRGYNSDQEASLATLRIPPAREISISYSTYKTAKLERFILLYGPLEMSFIRLIPRNFRKIINSWEVRTNGPGPCVTHSMGNLRDFRPNNGHMLGGLCWRRLGFSLETRRCWKSWDQVIITGSHWKMHMCEL